MSRHDQPAEEEPGQRREDEYRLLTEREATRRRNASIQPTTESRGALERGQFNCHRSATRIPERDTISRPHRRRTTASARARRHRGRKSPPPSATGARRRSAAPPARLRAPRGCAAAAAPTRARSCSNASAPRGDRPNANSCSCATEVHEPLHVVDQRIGHLDCIDRRSESARGAFDRRSRAAASSAGRRSPLFSSSRSASGSG